MSELQSLASRLENARNRLAAMREKAFELSGAIGDCETEIKDLLAQITKEALGPSGRFSSNGQLKITGGRQYRKWLRDKVINLLVEHDAMQAKEIAAHCEVSITLIYSLLTRLKRQSVVEKLEDNHWGLTEPELTIRRKQNVEVG